MLPRLEKCKHIVLADDDSDDRELFIEAMAEIDPSVTVLTVEDGDKLMNELKNLVTIPDIIFLDVNMPRKSGKECIAEIKGDDRLKEVPIVIYSTTLNKKDIDDAWNKGALCFMRKPDSYTKLKSILNEIVTTDFHKAELERTAKSCSTCNTRKHDQDDGSNLSTLNRAAITHFNDRPHSCLSIKRSDSLKCHLTIAQSRVLGLA